MKLLTKDITKRLPPLYSTSDKAPEDVSVVVKFFDPTGDSTFYGTEYCPEQRLFFGFVFHNRRDGELGYFSLDELISIRTAFGLKIERDIWWDGTKSLRHVIEAYQSGNSL